MRNGKSDEGHGTAEGGDDGGEQSEDDKAARVLLHALHVHLESGEEHDVEHPHFSEQFEGVVTFQDIEAIFAYYDAGEHHADDMGDAQLAHDDGGKQDDAQHDEENQRGVSDGKVM